MENTSLNVWPEQIKALEAAVKSALNKNFHLSFSQNGEKWRIDMDYEYTPVHSVTCLLEEVPEKKDEFIAIGKDLMRLCARINDFGKGFLELDAHSFHISYNFIRFYDGSGDKLLEKKEEILGMLSQLNNLIDNLKACNCNLKGDDWGSSTWLTYNGTSLCSCPKDTLLDHSVHLLAKAKHLSLLVSQIKAYNCELKGDEWGRDLILLHRGLVLHTIPGMSFEMRDEELIAKAKTFNELLDKLKHFGCNLRGNRQQAFLTYSGIALYACSPDMVADNVETLLNQAEQATHRYNAIKAQYTQMGTNKMVDLALPSGTRWATNNVGADSPFGTGNYYSWAETDPYDGKANKWLKGTIENPEYIKYTLADCKTLLDADDDVATAVNQQLHMPTEDEFDELNHFCMASWVENFLDSGTNGLLLVSKKNYRSIFLPAGGERGDKGCEGSGCCGNYWSASLCPQTCDYANAFYFSGGDNCLCISDRKHAFLVRPVENAEIKN